MRPMTRLMVATAVAAIGVAISGAASAAITGLTINPLTTLSPDRSGATLSGTITCTSGDSVTVFAGFTEVVGRTIQEATGSTGVSCTGAAQSWSVAATGQTGARFLPGRASAFVDGLDGTDFTSMQITQTILVRP
jgi:hypothetical protein